MQPEPSRITLNPDLDNGQQMAPAEKSMKRKVKQATREVLGNSVFWHVNGEKHREDGPAVESGAVKEWWAHGCHHKSINSYIRAAGIPESERTQFLKKWG